MQELVEELSLALANLEFMLVTAESCTGGMIAAAITDRAGSSRVFERGFVTYSNDAKQELLDVPADTLKDHGAVSAQTALAMVRGALEHSRAELALSVTGIAGPGGATQGKPVGLIYIGYGMRGDALHSAEHHFEGDRASIRRQAVEAALQHMLDFVETLP
jgi:nicotinamide-nucleotide amidase